MTNRKVRKGLTRRGFLQSSAVAGGLGTGLVNPWPGPPLPASRQAEEPAFDLAPARWIWYPFERFPANSFVLLRQEFQISGPVRQARGWVVADSRYELRLDGRRLQWGPVPSDPRWLEVDPLALDDLQPGTHVIGAQALYYGHGDGTWPTGKPGFIFRLEIEYQDGRRQRVVSDRNWSAHYAVAWKPGQYKRWYLRSLQEEFDARLYPLGWDRPGYQPDQRWVRAMEIDCPSDKPALCSSYREYTQDMAPDPAGCGLLPRRIPFMREEWVGVSRLRRFVGVEWRRPIREFFDLRIPESFREIPVDPPQGSGNWTFTPGESGVLLTFELPEQMVGWPGFSIQAPAGTTVELLIHDAHDPEGPTFLDLSFNAWSRFTCSGGLQQFRTFDYESGRWLQLHVHPTTAPVRIQDVGILRRSFPWPVEPSIETGDTALRTILRAAVNTLRNAAQDSVVDCMGRERQQYSGDVGHQIHALHLNCGDSELPARYIRSFNRGITLDGYFLDCWPAYDRLARVAQRQLGLTSWGPIVDHSIGHIFDCYHHLMYAGERDLMVELLPNLVRFARWLAGVRDSNGCLPVEGLGMASVWIDHEAYRSQRDKQCALNLYAAAMLEYALPAVAAAASSPEIAEWSREVGAELRRATTARFWDEDLALFVVNRPWDNGRSPRFCDRSLATAVLYGQSPGTHHACIDLLARRPAELGLSYPANHCWRFWALAEGGRVDVVLEELRGRWAQLRSVRENNSISETWDPKPDTTSQWSHCAVSPMFLFPMSVAGIRPLSPGFASCQIRPQFADLPRLELRTPTVQGPIEISMSGAPDRRSLRLALPPGMRGEVILDSREQVDLPELEEKRSGLRRFEVNGTAQLKGRFR
jgi:alpha-L-rhamnosidase